MKAARTIRKTRWIPVNHKHVVVFRWKVKATLPRKGKEVWGRIGSRAFTKAKDADVFVNRNKRQWDFHNVRVTHSLRGVK